MGGFDQIHNNLDFSDIRTDLETVGWTILGDGLAPDHCDSIKAEIDELADLDGTEVNYGGSEHRVWKAHEKSQYAEDFRRFSDNVMSSVTQESRAAFDILAIRNRTLPNDDSALKLGRWHLDSFRKQLKIFVFLSDVTEESGPFELIPESQRMGFKMRHTLLGDLITPNDLVNGTRKYQHLKENLIDRIVAGGYESKAFAVKAGTIAMVDTSGVHRARPCVKGERYALTSYYH